jgi:anti-sigma factor RsiW
LKRAARIPTIEIVPCLPCPLRAEETIEAYVMGTLPESEQDALEEHLLICAHCRALVEEADGYVRAMKEAARRISAQMGCT